MATFYDGIPNEIPYLRARDQGGNDNSYCRGEGFLVEVGTHTASADLDPRDEVPESSERDNTATLTWSSWTGPSPTPTIAQPPAPYDLVVDEVWVEDRAGIRLVSPTAGQVIRVAARWHIAGTGIARFTIRTSVNDQPLDTAIDFTSEAGRSFVMNTTLTYTVPSVGPVTARWELDPENTRHEVNELDNTGQYSWIVRDQGLPDISITEVSVADTAATLSSLQQAHDQARASTAVVAIVSPLLGDSSALNTRIDGVHLPNGGSISLTASLRRKDQTASEVNCGSTSISTNYFAEGTVYASVVCDTSVGVADATYSPIVRVSAMGFVDHNNTNNEAFGDKEIVPRKRPAGKVRLSSSFLALKSATVYNAANVKVATFQAESDGRIFGDLPDGNYRVAIATTMGVPLFDANSHQAYFVDAARTTDTAPAVSFDGSTPISCAGPGSCAALTIGGTSTSIGGEEGLRRRLLWEAAYALNGCQNNGGDPKKGCATATAGFTDRSTSFSLFPTFSYLATDEQAARTVFGGSDAYNGTCYKHNYPPSSYVCWVQYDPVEQVLQYARHPGKNPTTQAKEVPSDTPFSRGGQCKRFVALLLFRSGIRHKADSSYAPLPGDATIGDEKKKDIFPLATKANLQPGDVLRNPCASCDLAHALVVLARLEAVKSEDPPTFIVFDSNFSRGDGHEIISAHIMDLASLLNYRSLKCVYSDTCS